jgi:hypothetical protein
MKELAEYIYERDRHEFSLGDTLDIKTGLILASLTFLAIQSGDLIKSGLTHLPIEQRIMQIVALLAMAIGGVFCALELWPRDYDREAMPEGYERWITETEEYRKAYPENDSGPVTEDMIRSARLISAKKRLAKNGTTNLNKSRYMFVAFYGAIVAFSANMVTLAMRLF